jgi:hypothetical protein
MKTGGTSVSRAFRRAFSPAQTYPQLQSGDSPDRAPKLFVDRLEARRAELGRTPDFVSVHMPAWTADHFGPDHVHAVTLREPVARTVSHLRQIAAHDAMPDDLEEVFALPSIRARLTDYQTRMLATEDERDTPPALDDVSPEAFRESMLHFWVTAAANVEPMTDADLERAVGRLGAIDVVGTTDDLSAFAEDLSEQTGIEPPTIDHDNRGRGSRPVDPDLLDAIGEATRLDRLLYREARRLAS